MERVGLVGYVEEQLERAICLGRLPRSGQFGSEQKLARSYGVSRSTVREALRRLSARGLVVQHPGRKTRAMVLDESLTLENVGLALHDERSADGVRLLEGYFALKRQVLVELLADCCASASAAELGLLGDACFGLWEEARWESGARCARLEFDLLRLAARVADRPGHLLLIQSLQRGLPGLAARGVPLMDCESLRQWACCAMNALHERDARALEHELPALLRACDERVLERFAPAFKGNAGLKAHRAETRAPGGPASASEEDDSFGRHSTIEECGLGGFASASEADDSIQGHSTIEERDIVRLAPAIEVGDSLQGHSTIEERGLSRVAPAAESSDALAVAPRPHVEAVLVEPDSGTLSRAVPERTLSEPGGACAGENLPGAALSNSSDCRTGSCASRPEGDLPPEPPPLGSRGPTRVEVREEDGLLHGTTGQHPLTTRSMGCASLAPSLPTPRDHLSWERQGPVASASRSKDDPPSPEG